LDYPGRVWATPQCARVMPSGEAPQTAKSGLVGDAFVPLYQPSGRSSSLVESLHDHSDIGPIKEPLVDDVVERAHFYIRPLCVPRAEGPARLSRFDGLLKLLAAQFDRVDVGHVGE